MENLLKNKNLIIWIRNDELTEEKLKFYIDNGGDINYIDENGDNGLINAFYCSNLKTIKLLINYGININYKNEKCKNGTLLMISAIYQEIHLIKLLLKYNVNINDKTENGWSALLYAANNHEFNYLEIIKLLIDNGAFINQKNNKNESALTINYNKNDYKIFQYLLKNKYYHSKIKKIKKINLKLAKLIYKI